MYNNDQKLQFIESLVNDGASKQGYIILFKKTYAKMEKIFDKDICEMNYNELKTGIALLGSRDIKSIAWNISRLKQYVDWCIVNGKSKSLENHLELIFPQDIDNSYIFKREMLKNPEHLEDVLDVVYAPIEYMNLTNMYRIYMWLLYEGLTNTEAVSLKRNDIDLENGIITVDKRKIKVHPIFKDLLELTVPEDKLIKRNKNGEEKFHKLCDTDLVLRTFIYTIINREKQFGSRITEFNLKYKNETGEYIRLSPTRIYESGLYYRWYQLELNNEDIPYEDYVETDMEGKDYVIGNKYVFTDKLKDIKIAYSMWKKAFDY